MDPATSPFSALTLIVAPAVLTNASSILALGTSNRLARAVDRARQLTIELELEPDMNTPASAALLRELSAAQRRMPMLIRALQSFYAAVGSFAAAALISLIGAVFAPRTTPSLGLVMEVLAVCVGAVAVTALARGAWLLVRETRIVVLALEERMALVQMKYIEQSDKDNQDSPVS